MTLEESFVTSHLFETIRNYSKFCTICGKELDLTGEWHLPFCNKCRRKIIIKMRR